MIDERRLNKDFNEVDNITAVCRSNSSYYRGEYPELEIGKAYKVTHIGVFRSRTDLLLEGFGYKDYNSVCFDLYENGEPLGQNYTKDFRFLAPYLKEMLKHSNPVRYAERMKEVTIYSHLHNIEKEYGIKVLLAVQSGSRALGLESSNSDWDVCYLYIHKTRWYEQPEDHRHVIERVFDDCIDTYGWELRDALSYLKLSNLTILEWLNSPNSYIVHAPLYKRLNEIGRTFFIPQRMISFYNRTYNKLNERFLSEKGRIKEFLYYLRGVLACKWVENRNSIPPMDFTYLMDKTVDDEIIRSKVMDLIKIKKSGKNYDNVAVDIDLIETVRQWAEYYDALAKSLEMDLKVGLEDELNALFKDMVLQSNLGLV